MSPIFDNALDSLRVGMTLYISGNQRSSKKHAVLMVYDSIELLLKEYLYQASPILIYKNIDETISEDSVLVGFPEILIRLKNLNLIIPDEQASVTSALQSKRCRIRHLRYDQYDELVDVAQALKFALYFMECELKKQPDEHLEPELLGDILAIVENSNDPDAVAQYRLESWLKKKWPSWDQETEDIPKGFEGVDTCPKCQNEYLIMEQITKPYCFWCCSGVAAEYCESCGQPKIVGASCCASANLGAHL